eukprot:403372564
MASTYSPYKDKYLVNVPQSSDYTIEDIYYRPYKCFTQGLYFDLQHSTLVETCGQEGASKVQRLSIDQEKHQINGEKQTFYKQEYFGEGIALVDDNNYYAMTWVNRIALIIDRNTLNIVKEEQMPSQIREGWGATNSDQFMYLTDGSNYIHEVDRSTRKVVRSIYVKTKSGTPISGLNDLAYFKDWQTQNEYAWVNIFTQDAIIKVDLSTGVIEKRLNLSILLNVQEQYWRETNVQRTYYDKANQVLNGITYNSREDMFYITGKEWNFIFKMRLL